MKVQKISCAQFKKKYHLTDVDPWKTDVFSTADKKTLQREAGITGWKQKALQVAQVMPSLLRKPLHFLKNIRSYYKTHSESLKVYYTQKDDVDTATYPFTDYTTKCTIIAGFKPSTLLEIGTGNGWGITSFKSVLPNCRCITMSPKLTEETGIVVKRKKKLGIQQIWSDSLTYDFTKLHGVDVTYIDGDHTYRYVLSDLIQSHKITKKAIILDDYIPAPDAPHGAVHLWAWYHQEVVNAVHDFLRLFPHSIATAYWIEDTRTCVLIKK